MRTQHPAPTKPSLLCLPATSTLPIHPADDLKYDLHVLLVRHGKACPACAKAGSAKHKAATAGGGVDCPLADLKPPKSELLKLAAAAAPVGKLNGKRQKKQQHAEDGSTGGGGAKPAAAKKEAAAAEKARPNSKRRKVQVE